jgi:nicotinamidase-related amidase
MATSCAAPDTLTLHTRRRLETSAGVVAHEEPARWPARRTAIIVVDMWDDHWCAGAARRVAELAGPMDAMLAAARARGVTVVHAPSSVVDFYAGTPEREAARRAPFAASPVPLSTDERWGTTWCWPDPAREPDLPIDDADMGCDCATECALRDAWSRQIATLTIRPGDVVSDDGQEVHNLLAERGIENVILAGVHLNMCVLGRPVGIRQMVRTGKNVLLMRDMTDTMYASDQAPYVDHFTGTDLVVEHVERYWCPSITSADVTGAAPFRFSEDARE